MERFNIRVYGILLNENQELLVSHEIYKGLAFNKFPGGGLCLGESVTEGLVREFKEECNLDIEICRLLHVTEMVVSSAFDNSQVIGIYYLVKNTEAGFESLRYENIDKINNSKQSFRWIPFDKLSEDDFYFTMDKHALRRIITQI